MKAKAKVATATPTKQLLVDVHLSCPVSELFPFLLGLHTYMGMSFKEALNIYLPDESVRQAVLTKLIEQNLLDSACQPQVGVMSRIQTRWKTPATTPTAHFEQGHSLKTLADLFRAAVQRIQQSSGQDQPFVDVANPIAFLRRLNRRYRYQDIERSISEFAQLEGAKSRPRLTWAAFEDFLKGHIPIADRKVQKGLLNSGTARPKLKRLSR